MLSNNSLYLHTATCTAAQYVLLFLEYAIMKCLNLIGQCEGSKSLRDTVRGLYM